MSEQEKDLKKEAENVQTEDIEETAENSEESEAAAEETGGETAEAELNDRLMRQMAEFDNFRKRTEKEKQQMYSIGASEVVEKLLPVVDNFERGLAAMTEEEKETSFAQGIEMIYKQLMTVLEDLGVASIEAVGVEFNPDFHNAVMQAPSEEYASGVITQELQKGYLYKEKVVRHSMVIVAE